MDKGKERSESKEVEAREECTEAELKTVQGTGQASVGLGAGTATPRRVD